MTSPPRLTAVLVLYHMRLQESPCFRSLREAVALCGPAASVTLLVYDNSPGDGDGTPGEAGFPGELRYVADRSNGGLAVAYNAGLALARELGSAWLLLLDQDTVLTPGYLEELLVSLCTVPANVSAIIPRLMQGNVIHSPQQLPRLSHKPVPPGWQGLLPIAVTAFNSGAALRVAALRRFPDHYWLDFLDHAVFHELQAAGGRVWLLRADLQHHLSTERLGSDASLARYTNVLQAERDFSQEYGSATDRIFYRLRRAKQALGQALKVPNRRFALLSLRAALGLLPPTPARKR